MGYRVEQCAQFTVRPGPLHLAEGRDLDMMAAQRKES